MEVNSAIDEPSISGSDAASEKVMEEPQSSTSREPEEAGTGDITDDLSNQLDFSERSINFSELNVEQNDDSNDAFNALKESETDALDTPKDDSVDAIKEPAPTNENDEPKEETPPNTSDAFEAMETDFPDGAQTEEPSFEPNVETEKETESEKRSEDDQREPMDTDTEKPADSGAEAVEATAGEGQSDDDQWKALMESGSPNASESAQPDKDELMEGGTSETSESAQAMENDDEAEPAEDKKQAADEMGEEENAKDQQLEELEERQDELAVDAEKEPEDEQDAEMDKTGENEDITEIPDDDIQVETNEMAGNDADLCLFGVEEEEEGENQGDKDETEEDKETAETQDEDVQEVVEKEAQPAEEEPVDINAEPLKENEIREIVGLLTEQTCLNCENTTNCAYQLLEESGEIKFLCSFSCVKEHRDDNDNKYSLTQRKIVIDSMPLEEKVCSKCDETKLCKYRFKVSVFTSVTKTVPREESEEATEEPQEVTETVESFEEKFLCEEDCLQALTDENSEKYVLKEAQLNIPAEAVEEQQEVPSIAARSDADVESARLDREQSLFRKCAYCFETPPTFLQWETLDFCNEKCLGQHQSLVGAACSQCNQVVALASIGKLCVRFGADTKQFCTTECLNDFKKCFSPCSLCYKNLKDADGTLACISKRGKHFCDEHCQKTYDEIVNPLKNRPPYLCSVCNIKKSPEVVVKLDGSVHRICSNPCFSAFKFVNNVFPDQCDMCTRYFERKSAEAYTIFREGAPQMFCTQDCMTIFMTKNRAIWKCDWCKVSKYNYDMIQTKDRKNQLCSLNCLSLLSASKQSSSGSGCDQCGDERDLQYQLAMTDNSTRYFCTYQCALGFQSHFKTMVVQPSVVPYGSVRRITPRSNFEKRPTPVRAIATTSKRGRKPYNPIMNRSNSPIPVPELTVQLERLKDLPSRIKISSVVGGPSGWTPVVRGSRGTSPPVRVEHKTQVVTIPPLPKQVGNKSTMCKSVTFDKAISCRAETAEAECQTEEWLEQRVVVPLPIPLFIPQPMMMYSMPTPVAVPFVLPVPVPIFVPTTRNSADGIMKEIKKIQEKMPTDPYEAELLMMAEMVAGDKKKEVVDSDSDENDDIGYGDGIENNASFNEDLVQMAFKMAGNDFEDPPVDLENEMTANTISQGANAYGDDLDPHSLQHHQLLLLQQQREAAMQANRGRKRMPQQPLKPANNRNATPNKRIKREMDSMQPEINREPLEKPDANMCLKYTFGVNAWKQWVATKNADLEKSSIRRKPIKSEILQLTADELNYSLCLFVKEVRKPNGSEYAPDTIYYLVLGIQQYLYENGRIDNIFTDRFYESFTDGLDEVAKKFSVLYNDSQYIVTRVEEEHLWECKQLGAHSPHVLLSTLMFFNTKHFNLVTVDEHMELSFSHIMKHWKRNPNQPGATKLPGSRNVLLRFYPPQSSLEANSRKKKVYEQQENEDNPLRCPVKLYEFYLSKCPESVKTRNDVFYLQPERSCVPDSPVWYSTQPLGRDALSKMLHRVKMVKEINIALLTS